MVLACSDSIVFPYVARDIMTASCVIIRFRYIFSLQKGSRLACYKLQQSLMRGARQKDCAEFHAQKTPEHAFYHKETQRAEMFF